MRDPRGVMSTCRKDPDEDPAEDETRLSAGSEMCARYADNLQAARG
jgi:hypothetical protein